MSAARIDAKKGGSWLGAYVLVYLVFLYLPVSLIPLFSFNDSIQAAFPLQGFTFEWYATLFGNSALSGALANSLVIGAIAATGATLCGITVSYMDLYGRSPLALTISAIARLPILIPGVIVGISLLILVNLIGFGPSRIAIVLGHILVALPTTVVIMKSRFAAIPKTIREAALDLGASDWTTFRRVMLPLSLPAIVSAFMLAFLTSFDEFIVAFFLAGTEPTLPLYIWSQLRFPKSLPTVMALGTAILALSFVIAAMAEILRHRGLAAAQRPVPADLSKPEETERGELQWHST
ncbi:MAG: ABC transporter permease subunit [Mesorhizobium sp.]|uniref:ABC transporter permease n=1 Tax=unclassified Mesorhizobium TaxID=325217 RepID=UPI000F759A00|nr:MULTISPECIES: ABC transporter permease [unclassified Mesorhizobium]AZO64056.1 ABC transporter permease [Mesorhizobium sp. M6A.T.Cr.TU.016.01.1.1]RUU43150.1 ABC transporter permease subunit [Mesorhizobium sp. M6A.T.Ce.TU.002.03.1.1]RWN32412.1 MAG: ABC transporter permease subunit [Mesorhizobium sp.]RWP49838.1 MAG: ABC transporter permease subunit [Mesorhizobium sp.]RWP53259.1 MAG: ABC transporter permease subunit [Mesorhizobium sp.]